MTMQKPIVIGPFLRGIRVQKATSLAGNDGDLLPRCVPPCPDITNSDTIIWKTLKSKNMLSPRIFNMTKPMDSHMSVQ